jgi:hypothetical protein
MFTLHTTTVYEQNTMQIVGEIASYHGPAEVVIKRLGWRRLSEASDALVKGGMATVRDMGGVAVVQEFQRFVDDSRKHAAESSGDVIEDARTAVAEAKKANPLTGYDQNALCLMGIVTLGGVEKTPELVDDLEPDVLTGIARAVLKLARPGLFESESDRGNV